MAKKRIPCVKDSIYPPVERSVIAKIGHIKREIRTNNRLSDKSIERLIKILTSDFDTECCIHDEQTDAIIQSIKEHRNFDGLDDYQEFIVYEDMEMARFKLIYINPETF